MKRPLNVVFLVGAIKESCLRSFRTESKTVNDVALPRERWGEK